MEIPAFPAWLGGVVAFGVVAFAIVVILSKILAGRKT